MNDHARSAHNRCALALCVALAGLGALRSLPVQAQAVRPSLEKDDFNIDLVVGPVLGGGNIIGLSGAFTALATGIEGAPWNAATYASRGLWNTDWFEWDVTGSLVPGTVRNSDFDNNGESGFAYDSFIYGTLGGGVQFGAFGVGALLNVQTYDISKEVMPGTRIDSRLTLVVGNYGVGYALADGQFVVGAGGRTASLNITDPKSGQSLVDFGGTGPEAGVLLRLADQPWRLGFAARLPVESEAAGTPVAAGFTLPERIHLPWEMQVGFAWQFGPRPLNRIWVNPNDVEQRLRTQMLARRRTRTEDQQRAEAFDARMRSVQQSGPPTIADLESPDSAPSDEGGAPRDPEFWKQEDKRRWDEEREMLAEVERLRIERERSVLALPRRHLLISTETILVGTSDNAVGLESFLLQARQDSGKRVTVGVRLGIEGEPIANWVKMRAGTYLEPSRFAGVSYRTHGTLGTDVKLFTWDLFELVEPFTVCIGGSADVAERYLNLGIGLGLWH
jgi:hypothetical protein